MMLPCCPDLHIDGDLEFIGAAAVWPLSLPLAQDVYVPSVVELGDDDVQ